MKESFIVGFIKQIWFLNICASIIYSVAASVYFSSIIQPDPTDLTKFWFRVFITTVYWTITFITGLALLYLFLRQGRKVLKRKASQPAIADLAARSITLRQSSVQPSSLILHFTSQITVPLN